MKTIQIITVILCCFSYLKNSLLGQVLVNSNKNESISISFVYNDFFFGEETDIERFVNVNEGNVIHSFSQRTTFQWQRGRFVYGCLSSIGGAIQNLNAGFMQRDRIENFNLKGGFQLGTWVNSKVAPGYNLLVGGGGNGWYGNFKRFQQTPSGLEIVTQRSFLNYGANFFLDSNYFFENGIGVTLPLTIEYYFDQPCFIYSLGIGLIWKLE